MGFKEMFVKWGIPTIGAYFVLAPHAWHMTIPVVKIFAHNQHQAFGLGMLAASGLALLLMRK